MNSYNIAGAEFRYRMIFQFVYECFICCAQHIIRCCMVNCRRICFVIGFDLIRERDRKWKKNQIACYLRTSDRVRRVWGWKTLIYVKGFWKSRTSLPVEWIHQHSLHKAKIGSVPNKTATMSHSSLRFSALFQILVLWIVWFRWHHNVQSTSSIASKSTAPF